MWSDGVQKGGQKIVGVAETTGDLLNGYITDISGQNMHFIHNIFVVYFPEYQIMYYLWVLPSP